MEVSVDCRKAHVYEHESFSNGGGRDGAHGDDDHLYVYKQALARESGVTRDH